jgi:ribonuclease E
MLDNEPTGGTGPNESTPAEAQTTETTGTTRRRTTRRATPATEAADTPAEAATGRGPARRRRPAADPDAAGPSDVADGAGEAATSTRRRASRRAGAADHAGPTAAASATAGEAAVPTRRRASRRTGAADGAQEAAGSPADAGPTGPATGDAEPAAAPARRTRRRAAAEPAAIDGAAGPAAGPAAGGTGRSRRSAGGTAAEPTEAPPTSADDRDRPASADDSAGGRRRSRLVASDEAVASDRAQAGALPPASVTFIAPAAEVVTAVEAEPAGTPARRRRTRATAATEPAESAATPAEIAVDEDETTEAAERRRRRRGRRGRGRGRGGADDVEETGEDSATGGGRRRAGTATAQPAVEDETARGATSRRRASRPATEEAETARGATSRRRAGRPAAEEAKAEADATAPGADGAAPGSRATQPTDIETAASRRRRRRRRATADEGEGPRADDPPNTVVHVREARALERGTDDDEVRGVRGSTRLEAKRQRRRDGRDQGRRRPPILSEAEFLARREAVDREMVVRQRGDRTQIAVLEDGVLVEHYVTKATATSYAGNIYLGRVQNVLPSMEAAFIDIGKGRNAVLYAGEVDWDVAGLEGKARSIEQALKSGDTVVVQVTKDPIGHKGARLTSQVSLPGRYLVYVPGGSMTGISRKLPDTERARLKDILRRVVPDDAGVIIRTAAEGASEQELARDVQRLHAQWEVIQAKANGSTQAPALLYEEPDLAIRVVRDVFNEDFSRLVVAGDEAWDTIEQYVAHVAPDLVPRLSRHTAETDAFADMRIDEQLAKALDRKVWLPSGGSLVIDRTEAMTVIDVNTGRFTGQGGTLEQTVTRNNLEAAEEIVRQLRLRDVGGIVVIDFIDMVLESNRELVLRRLTECLGRDRTKHQVAEVTSLGLVQMTRKRVGQGLLEAFSEPCPTCGGRGLLVHSEPIDDGRRRAGTGAAESAPAARASRRGRQRAAGEAAEPAPEQPARRSRATRAAKSAEETGGAAAEVVESAEAASADAGAADAATAGAGAAGVAELAEAASADAGAADAADAATAGAGAPGVAELAEAASAGAGAADLVEAAEAVGDAEAIGSAEAATGDVGEAVDAVERIEPEAEIEIQRAVDAAVAAPRPRRRRAASRPAGPPVPTGS